MRTIYRLALIGSLAVAGFTTTAAPANALHDLAAPCTDGYGNLHMEGEIVQINGVTMYCGPNGAWQLWLA